MTAWYNEPDPYAAAWLRNLISAGLIAPGIVDERKIQDVEAWELVGYTQCHFFAGIGIWSGALRAAGWSDDRPIWTGSCPCQPFSAAGKQKGFTDERHLWPMWFGLVEQCKPAIVVGEQVASKDGLGWFDLVSTDMERAGYAVGAVDLCAAGFGQAHLRQRLYFVGMGDGIQPRLEGQPWNVDGSQGRSQSAGPTAETGGIDGMADTLHTGRPERRTVAGNGSTAGSSSSSPRPVLHSRQTGSLYDADWLLCRNPAREPSWRPVEPGTFPLAHGVSNRVGKLRSYGNALDFATAQSFCEVLAEIAGIRPVAEYDL